MGDSFLSVEGGGTNSSLPERGHLERSTPDPLSLLLLLEPLERPCGKRFRFPRKGKDRPPRDRPSVHTRDSSSTALHRPFPLRLEHAIHEVLGRTGSDIQMLCDLAIRQEARLEAKLENSPLLRSQRFDPRRERLVRLIRVVPFPSITGLISLIRVHELVEPQKEGSPQLRQGGTKVLRHASDKFPRVAVNFPQPPLDPL